MNPDDEKYLDKLNHFLRNVFAQFIQKIMHVHG